MGDEAGRAVADDARHMAFKATVSDRSLYFKRSRSGRLMVIYRFVDDMQGSYHADDAAEFQQNVALLQKRFNIKQLKTATWMLGMRITRRRAPIRRRFNA